MIHHYEVQASRQRDGLVQVFSLWKCAQAQVLEGWTPEEPKVLVVNY
ncbi:MAG: hypothetical protein HC945_00635 [Nitrosarchaeum sp.]|nr:hypothetical protein [Nitrosarchaeum sp.]